jgi:hypothetical protein
MVKPAPGFAITFSQEDVQHVPVANGAGSADQP